MTFQAGDIVRRRRAPYGGVSAPFIDEVGTVVEVTESALFRLRVARVRWPKIVTECALDALEPAPGAGRGA